ncbi:MAG: hypothetical protein NTW11_03590 [Candidatus Staskawiczbacteria bacterium]|nr:hypothetical protein [Candidatus Staskawiczbacteria bacterium]
MADEQPKKPTAQTDNKQGDNEEEITEGEGSGGENGNSGNLTSPEGVLMLTIAGIIDVISIIPVINVVSDILGIIIIGGWLLFTRTGEAIKRATVKLLIACGVELIPVVSILPGWTWFVYSTLTDGGGVVGKVASAAKGSGGAADIKKV